MVMQPGGREGLGKGETIEDATVALYGASEVETRAADRMRFLAETEKAYFDGMRSFIKKDLGVKALVTGTIVFGPCGLYAQSDMDYVDAHAYWHHPNFPGRPWDPGNWTVEQVAMVDKSAESTLPGLSACRLAGQAVYGERVQPPGPERLPGRVRADAVVVGRRPGLGRHLALRLLAQPPARPITSPSTVSSTSTPTPPSGVSCRPGALIFRDGGIPPFRDCRVQGLGGDGPDPLGQLVRLHLKFRSNMLAAANSVGRIGLQELLTERMAVTLKGVSTTTAREGGSPGPEMEWTVGADGKGLFRVVGQAIWVFVGTRINHEGKGFAAMTETPLDGRPFGKSKAVLITACGRCENTGMQFSADRRTVGRNWGKAPVLIEALESKFLYHTKRKGG